MDRPRRPGLSHQSSVSSSPNKQAARGADSNDWLNEAVGLSGTKKEMPKSDSTKQVNICIGYQLWDLVIKNLYFSLHVQVFFPQLKMHRNELSRGNSRPYQCLPDNRFGQSPGFAFSVMTNRPSV